MIFTYKILYILLSSETSCVAGSWWLRDSSHRGYSLSPGRCIADSPLAPLPFDYLIWHHDIQNTLRCIWLLGNNSLSRQISKGPYLNPTPFSRDLCAQEHQQGMTTYLLSTRVKHRMHQCCENLQSFHTAVNFVSPSPTRHSVAHSTNAI